MVWFDQDSEQARAYDLIINAHKTSSCSEEVMTNAAAFEAAKAYEGYVSQNGKPCSYQQATQIASGAIGAFVDRIAETKGLKFVDVRAVKRHACQQTEQALSREY